MIVQNVELETLNMLLIYLHSSGEADEVGTNAEPCTTAGLGAHAGHIHIKDAEGGSGGEGDQSDLIESKRLLRDSEGRDGDEQALNEVLDGTLNEFCEVETVHIIE